MIRSTRVFVLIVFVMSLCAAPAIAQTQQTPAKNVKAAYVNMQRVLQSDSGYQEAMQKLQEYQRNLQRKMQKKRQELTELQKQLQQEGSLLSADQRKKKQQQMRKQMQSLQQRAQRSQQMVQQRRAKLLKPVLEKIDPVVRSVAEEQGYNVIYSYGQRDNPSVLWVAEELNITDDIIERLESKE